MTCAHAIRENGFSLVELLVVLSLLSVLIATSVLSGAQAHSSVDVRMAAQQVALDLRVARLRSITEQVEHRLIFAAGTSFYRRQRLGSEDFEEDGAPRSLPRGVKIQTTTTGANGITFRPRGNAYTFGTVRLSAPNAPTRDVVVDIAGRISVR